MRFPVRTGLSVFFLSLSLLTTACDSPPGDAVSSDDDIMKVSTPVMGTAGTGQFRTEGAATVPITYHNGPVLLGTTNVYYIWYGNWGTNTAKTILPTLAQNIGGSSYFNINTSYYNGAGTAVTNSVAYVTSINDNYSHGRTLTDSAVQSIVINAINGSDPRHQSGKLPYDANGVYFVLTTSDVSERSGFCNKYCGWHTYASTNKGFVQFAFIGNPDRCPTACEAQYTSPNGNPGADGMASIISHELEESVTDPELNAWYDSQGEENADKCAWTFGTTSTASNGSQYNVVLNGTQFLIQQNWVNSGAGYCAMSY
jgi:hypothetical protein